jgi:hypothetical protein
VRRRAGDAVRADEHRLAQLAAGHIAQNVAFLRPAPTETLSTATLTLPPKLEADLSRLRFIIGKLRGGICCHFANFSKRFGNVPGAAHDPEKAGPPDWIRDGCGFPEKIVLEQNTKAP